MRAFPRVSWLLWSGALLVGCAADQAPVAPSLNGPAYTQPAAPLAPLVLHVVPPQSTDPAIDHSLSDHYVWLDTVARSNQQLLVFMPGTNGAPASFKRVGQAAARLGYHVIELMFQNDKNIGLLCTNNIDADCYEKARLEILDGVDRSPVVDVSAANSINNRLLKLLEYLVASYPGEGWENFLAQGEPKWNHIAIGGFSQGGGQAALIARLHLVSRVVMFSSPNDSVHQEAAPWVTIGETPSERFFGLAHHLDQGVNPILASWDSLGMAAFGPVVTPETSQPPYGGTHMFVTEVTPQSGSLVQADVHRSTANDNLTPLAPDGTPVLLDVWTYMLSAPRSGPDGLD